MSKRWKRIHCKLYICFDTQTSYVLTKVVLARLFFHLERIALCTIKLEEWVRKANQGFHQKGFLQNVFILVWSTATFIEKQRKAVQK